MNYRHAFHAGNHADVLKHIVLSRVIEYFKNKEKPFAFLDAHAGLGAYDLEGIQANKTGEWMGGVGKMSDPFAPEVEALLQPYRSVVAAMNAVGGSRFYPGSPELAVRLMRPVDRIIVNELHPVDVETLRENYKLDKRVRVTSLDAVQSVKAELPFSSKRGLVLIDPPFEVLDESERVAQAIQFGHRRFATGTFLIWYPVTTEEFTEKFLDMISALAMPNILKVELRVKAAFERGGLSGSGMIVVNPPWTLEAELKQLIPSLATRLGIGTWGRGEISWLTPPQ
jgi:23S rRNA (adenine2030-N6)-methyltransferase